MYKTYFRGLTISNCPRGDILPQRKEGEAIFSWNPHCYHCTIPGCKAMNTDYPLKRSKGEEENRQ
jgi:hypothetical protein